VFVRPNPTNPELHQVVILDHGLYRELEEDFRINWCHLWKAMIENNTKDICIYAEKIGVHGEDQANLLANMILMRAHNDGTRVGLGYGMTPDEVKQIAG
jgi:aarF domain-containing kinase